MTWRMREQIQIVWSALCSGRVRDEFEIQNTVIRSLRSLMAGLEAGVFHRDNRITVFMHAFESGTQIVDGDRIIGGATDDILVGGAGDQTWLVARAMMR